MERIVIIDHDSHTLYVEDVSEETIEKYGGEEKYIEANYCPLGYYSWDFIVNAMYYPHEETSEVHEIDFDSMCDD